MAKELTPEQLNQLAFYVAEACKLGTYYGRKDYFLKRQLAIADWLEEKGKEAGLIE
jgi:hypothetical protein